MCICVSHPICHALEIIAQVKNGASTLERINYSLMLDFCHAVDICH